MTTRKRVLLVGNCGGTIGGSEGPLRRGDVEVRTAASGVEALALHRAHNADLIVTDLDISDMTAQELCERVRSDESSRNVSLLVLCGSDDVERRRAADCKANAHIVRPVDGEALARQVTRLLAIPARASFRVLARVTVGGRDRAHSFFCTSENLSAAGILVETEEDLAVGQTLECAFFLPGGLQLAAGGRVVRKADLGEVRQFGVEFVDLAPEAAVTLDAFVEKWRLLLSKGGRA